MSTAVQDPQTAPEEPQTAPEPPQQTAEAERTRHDLFEYSRWLHVGEGAEECEHNKTVEEHGRTVVRASGQCTNPEHFHAWIRLPNQFQIRDIVEKARAASARKKRALRDPDSDPAIIMEAELDEMRDESLRPVLIEEILQETYYDAYQNALRNLAGEDDPDAPPDEESGEAPKLWAHIEQDEEEYNRLTGLAEDERDGDEYERLGKRIENYRSAIDAEVERLQKPKRDVLEEKPMDGLIEQVRRRRIESLGTEEYLHTFNAWQWYVCTYKPVASGIPRDRIFSDISVFKFQTPRPVIDTLEANFQQLSAKLARSRGLGNS